ncbi:hypothetical protein RSOLAG1IB_04885 [Rhizoctonia solani AG-1 IB]|uniref:WD40 domain-containing protein n=1 Tax=Thanatephorus cucumeris (strain AG1-IB / isolate 7/3/14) TaxID=1108050 RepID=A0A0B7G0B0_THACB|nr:hypothetical protein RSOLAG1IB_04885 [Rhizoctonia solani AG-1 IB]
MSYGRKSHVVHQIQSCAISRTRSHGEEELPLSPGCRITALAVSNDPEGYQVAGDDRGWIFIRQPRSSDARETRAGSFHNGRFDENGIYISPVRWFCDMGLMTKITAINIIQDRVFVASFGPHAKIMVGALDATQESDVSAFILEPAKAHDLWTAVFESDGRTGSATLGLHGKAMYVQDLDNRMDMRTLHTGSDVMSICKRQDIVYTGERSGTVRLFDLRSDSVSTGSPLVRMDSMVTNVEVYRDWEMIVVAAKGDMRSFDMRFMRTEPGGKTKPLLEFLGHRNAHMNDLGFEVLPSGDFVIAAGIDKIVRAWSTKTGERVPIPTQGSPRALLDERPLEDQVLAIRATESNVWHSTGRSDHSSLRTNHRLWGINKTHFVVHNPSSLQVFVFSPFPRSQSERLPLTGIRPPNGEPGLYTAASLL